MSLNEYIANLNANITHGDYTELTHRKAFGQLLDKMLCGSRAFEETGNNKGNKPDYIVEKGKTPIGFIETKDLKIELGRIEKEDQLRRYYEAIGNVILTNYLEFRWYLKGENQKDNGKCSLVPIQTIHVAEIVGNKVKSCPDGEEKLAQLLKAFTEAKVSTVRDPRDLASRLSSIAILIRNSISALFESDDDELSDERQLLEGQLNAFKENLISDLEPPQFADMYAQTICYGLFSAKIALAEKALTWETASFTLPNTNPFLKRIFNEFTQELPDSVKKHIGLVVNLLNHTDLESVLSGFGKGSAKDPIFHFYETFLSEYNPREKEHRGVYYTPEPVVSYIVRSVDIILKEKFGMKKGLADSEEIILPDGSRSNRLIILDPATGTGTFLYSVLGRIFDNLGHGRLGKLSKSDVEAIDREILTRIYGFELMMAPYTIAHMKLGLFLQEKGYSGSSRLNIYLTNTLDRHHEKIERLPGGGFERVIAIESVEASKAKTSLPIMVVIGNPPYSGHSANKIPWMDRLMRGQDDTVPGFHETLENTANYFKVDGQGLGERNPKWLNDDYVKFIRWGQWRIDKTGAGVLAFITNHGYLDNPTFRGMRQSLLETFDEIYVLDLHGNTKKKEACPDGSKDENVFDIQQGVSIGLFVKLPKDEILPTPLRKGGKEQQYFASIEKGGARRAEGSVFHADLYGLREVFENKNLTGGKYHWLLENDIRKTEWKQVNPAKPFYMFIEQNMELKPQYDKYIKVSEIFPINGSGIITKRDDLTIDLEKNILYQRVKKFSTLNEQEARITYDLPPDVRDWRYDWAIEDLRKSGIEQKLIKQILYRPFDKRWIYYTGNSRGFIGWPVVQIMRHMLAGENIGIMTTKKVEVGRFAHAYIVNNITESHSVSLKEINYLFPLYLYPDPNPSKLDLETSPWPEGRNGRRPNLDKRIVDKIASDLGLAFIPDGKGNITALPPQANQPSPFGRRCPEGTDEGVSLLPSPSGRGESEGVSNVSKQPHPNPLLKGEGENNVDLLKGEGAITFGPEDLFNYIYAVLYSPTYRTRFADFLKYDFPRVPFTKDAGLFRQLAILGQKLAGLHLLEDSDLEDFRITFHQTSDESVVESVSYENGKVRINKSEYFEGIHQNVWEFMVGGYQVAQKLLKDRKGRALSHEDRLTYAKIMTALEKTIAIMAEIDILSINLFQ